MCRCISSPMRLRRSVESPTSSGRAVGAAAASGRLLSEGETSAARQITTRASGFRCVRMDVSWNATAIIPVPGAARERWRPVVDRSAHASHNRVVLHRLIFAALFCVFAWATADRIAACPFERIAAAAGSGDVCASDAGGSTDSADHQWNAQRPISASASRIGLAITTPSRGARGRPWPRPVSGGPEPWRTRSSSEHRAPSSPQHSSPDLTLRSRAVTHRQVCLRVSSCVNRRSGVCVRPAFESG